MAKKIGQFEADHAKEIARHVQKFGGKQPRLNRPGRRRVTGGGDGSGSSTECVPGISKNSNHKVALTEDWDSGETIDITINGVTKSVKNNTATNFSSGDVVIVSVLDDCSIEPLCCVLSGSNPSIATPCSDCTCECVEQFKSLELIIPKRIVSGNATIDFAEEHTLIHDGTNWVGGIYEGSCASGRITVEDTVASVNVASTSSVTSTSATVCQASNCNPPFGITAQPFAAFAPYVYNSLLTTGDRKNPTVSKVQYFQMTATDGTDTYVCRTTSTAKKSIGLTYQCHLVFIINDETGLQSMNIFPTTLDSLIEHGASTWQSTLSFDSGVVSLAHANDGSVLNDVVPDGANPAWTGTLPWTGVFDIRDASETLTGDSITITISELP